MNINMLSKDHRDALKSDGWTHVVVWLKNPHTQESMYRVASKHRSAKAAKARCALNPPGYAMWLEL